MPGTKTCFDVALLGLGAMGSRMARRLLDAGHGLTVWNRTPDAARALVEKGAQWAPTPKEAAAGARVVLVMVRDDQASKEVWFGSEGAAEGLEAGDLAIDSSTLTPAWIRELGAGLQRLGASLVEAPVVGSRPQAEAGQLICLAGGKREEVDRAQVVLSAFAGRVCHLGELGQGAAAKLAVNTFFAAQVVAAAELVPFLRRSGIEDERWLDLFSHVPVVAPPVLGAMKGMALGRFAPLFPVELVEKDLRYFLAAADGLEITPPIAETVQKLYSQAIEAGLGGQNLHGIVNLFEP